jgi:mannose-6-phosphate isomerase
MSEPLELVPQFATAVWGGRRFAHLPGAPTDAPVAEVWLVSDLDHRPTPIAHGPHQGRSIRETLGGEPFPVLLKLIDAKTSLSVQVHPDDEKAQLRGHARGKTEAWAVIHAEPGSRIYAGLQRGVDAAALAAAISENRIETVLHSFEPLSGDLVYLPAGTIHALGGGVTIFEVQQSCDVTYRLYDWGRPREIHIAEALECMSYDGPVHPLHGRAIISPYFELHVYREQATIGGDGRMRALVAHGGAVHGCVDVPAETAAIVPAMTGECQLTPDPGAWLFECIIP